MLHVLYLFAGGKCKWDMATCIKEATAAAAATCSVRVEYVDICRSEKMDVSKSQLQGNATWSGSMQRSSMLSCYRCLALPSLVSSLLGKEWQRLSPPIKVKEPVQAEATAGRGKSQAGGRLYLSDKRGKATRDLGQKAKAGTQRH